METRKYPLIENIPELNSSHNSPYTRVLHDSTVLLHLLLKNSVNLLCFIETHLRCLKCICECTTPRIAALSAHCLSWRIHLYSWILIRTKTNRYQLICSSVNFDVRRPGAAASPRALHCHVDHTVRPSQPRIPVVHTDCRQSAVAGAWDSILHPNILRILNFG